MPQPWWMTDRYTIGQEFPPEFNSLAGPAGVAVVRAYKDGRTDPGWGLVGKDGKPGFMVNYTKGRFRGSRVLPGYQTGRWNFAFVMRSLSMVCIDIDGKNGGLQHALRLGMLPHTLAETSKSGTGYHLFYTTPDDVWSDDYGFAMINDRIGIQQGVDIRSTGCVFHHPQQRWNDRAPVPLPKHLLETLLSKQQSVDAQVATIIKLLDAGDQEEVLFMHDALLEDLKKPIPPGRRNNTLFAIGSQMFLAQVPDWETHVRNRAMQVGLALDEIDKLVRNISNYAPKAATP